MEHGSIWKLIMKLIEYGNMKHGVWYGNIKHNGSEHGSMEEHVWKLECMEHNEHGNMKAWWKHETCMKHGNEAWKHEATATL
jgi:hypothetical protein